MAKCENRFEKDRMNRHSETDIFTISTNPYDKYLLVDNGGRRSGGDRRNYSYSIHLPERRARQDRRSGIDRRKFPRYKCE